MVNLPPVGGLIPARDDPNEHGAIRKLPELDGLVLEAQGRKNTALRGSSADERHVSPASHAASCHTGIL